MPGVHLKARACETRGRAGQWLAEADRHRSFRVLAGRACESQTMNHQGSLWRRLTRRRSFLEIDLGVGAGAE